MIDHPSLAAQEHPNPNVPKPWAGLGEIANPHPHPQRGLILGPTALREATGPQATDLKGHPKPLGEFPAACRPQTFFLSASDNVCFSSERSATSRFNRPFSSPAAGGGATRSRPRATMSSSTRKTGPHSRPTAGRCRRRDSQPSLGTKHTPPCSSENFDRFMGPLLSCWTTEADRIISI